MPSTIPPTDTELDSVSVADATTIQATEIKNESTSTSTTTSLTCEYCNTLFPSKNKLFRHLRFGIDNYDNACAEKVRNLGSIPFQGNFAPSRQDALRALVVNTSALSSGTSKSTKQSQTSKPQQTSKENQTQKTGPQKSAQNHLSRSVVTTSPLQELWMGGIPQKYASVKQIRQLIWSTVGKSQSGSESESDQGTKEEERSWTIHVKKLVRKGYREGAGKEWIAFAILAFQSENQASRAMELLNGRIIVKGGMVQSQSESNGKNQKKKSNKEKSTEAETVAESVVNDNNSDMTENLKKKIDDSAEPIESLTSVTDNPKDEDAKSEPAKDFVFYLKPRATRPVNKDITKVTVAANPASDENDESTTTVGINTNTNSDISESPAAKSNSNGDSEDPNLSIQTTPSDSTPSFQERLYALSIDELLRRWKALLAKVQTVKCIDELNQDLANLMKTESHKVAVAKALCKQYEIAHNHNDNDINKSASNSDSNMTSLFHHVLLQGRPIPEPLRTNLHNALKNLDWPIQKHRQRLRSDHYVVVWRGKPRQEFKEIYPLFEDLMAWAEDKFPWTHIAVTKNFIGSPHTDEFDQNFQFCCSFGDFETPGGELCCEEVLDFVEGQQKVKLNLAEKSISLNSMESDEISDANFSKTKRLKADNDNQCVGNTVTNDTNDGTVTVTTQDSEMINPRLEPYSTLYTCTTKDRLVKVDGRHLHYVNGYKGGDRYSLVFYCLDEKTGYRKKERAVDWEWMRMSDSMQEGEEKLLESKPVGEKLPSDSSITSSGMETKCN